MESRLKNDIETRRRKLAIKSMYFNRFLLVRYITAVFFFAFLNWTLAMFLVKTGWAIVPFALFLTTGAAAVEQVKLYNYPKDHAALSIVAYKVLSASLTVLSAILFTPFYQRLFPFLNAQPATRQILISLTAFALLLTFVVLKRLARIKNREDKQFQRIRAMQAVLT